MQFSVVTQLTGADCLTCYPLYYARKSKGQPVTADPLILIDGYVNLVFSPEKTTPDSLWRAETCQTTCLFSSYLH